MNDKGRFLPNIPKLVGDNKWEVVDHDEWLRDKVYYTQIDADLTKEMYDYCNENKDSFEDAHDILVGNIKGQYKIPHKDKENNLILRVSEMLKRNLGTFIQSPIEQLMLDNLWVNYQGKHEYNPNHSHTGIFSFVWYLDFPKEIHEENAELAEAENAPLNINRGCIEFLSTKFGDDPILMLPNTNDFFLFTADHRHCVYPFESDVTRVSVSGNISRLFLAGGN